MPRRQPAARRLLVSARQPAGMFFRGGVGVSGGGLGGLAGWWIGRRVGGWVGRRGVGGRTEIVGVGGWRGGGGGGCLYLFPGRSDGDGIEGAGRSDGDGVEGALARGDSRGGVEGGVVVRAGPPLLCFCSVLPWRSWPLSGDSGSEPGGGMGGTTQRASTRRPAAASVVEPCAVEGCVCCSDVPSSWSSSALDFLTGCVRVLFAVCVLFCYFWRGCMTVRARCHPLGRRFLL